MKFKKPKFWDLKKPNIYSYILLPIAFLIQVFAYFKKKTKINDFKIKTICVGNIYVGGTGKTSLCIKINEILKKKNIRSCFIKKFYKDQLDEQKILKNRGQVFSSKVRVDSIKQAEHENYEVAIIDDGLQDSSINYDKSIVCFNNINWIGNGMVIPSGPLREKLFSIRNYDCIFLNGNLENLETIKKEIVTIHSKANIYIGQYKILNIDEINLSDNYFAFSGIGNHKTFLSTLKEHKINVMEDLEFPDHYEYTNKDLDKIITSSKKFNSKIITTEKDYLRIDNQIKKEIQFVKSELIIIDEEKFIKQII
tara:strand:- start:239 stop:1165 length:927 start_codon:yes stop_codon:yes gene_type:complete